jgi:hypothetical protein
MGLIAGKVGSSMLLFLGLAMIAGAIVGAAFLFRNTVFTVRVSQGYLVPKEMIPQKSGIKTDDSGEKRASRRARDTVMPQ